MLVLSRKPAQQIHVGDNVRITLLKVKGNQVRLGIEAPRNVKVLRGELSPRKTSHNDISNVIAGDSGGKPRSIS